MTELSDFDKYQVEARKTAIYPNLGNNLWYPALGLAGEAGEVAENIKKVYRDDNSIISSDRRDRIIKELGDVLWYIANIATELHINLSTVASSNLSKLQDRANRGVVHGSGDTR